MFIANVLKCRPPGNRDPHPIEIDNCRDYLVRQVELIEPQGRLHAGQLRHQAPARRHRPASRACTGSRRSACSGPRAVRLYPLYHPAAALYTPSHARGRCATDFARIPELLALPAPDQPEPAVEIPEVDPEELRVDGLRAQAEPEPEPPASPSRSWSTSSASSSQDRAARPARRLELGALARGVAPQQLAGCRARGERQRLGGVVERAARAGRAGRAPPRGGAGASSS